jgi:16S rRNA (guanine1207-N2)-methyltransferase
MLEDVMDTLLFAWRVTPLPVAADDEILIVGGRVHGGAADTLGGRRLWVQPFQPWATQLEGETVVELEPGDEARFAHALVLPTPQREAAMGEIARAILAVKPGGSVTVAAPNKLGAERYQKFLASLLGDLEVWSRRHCRVFRGVRTADLDLGPVREAAALDAVRPVLDGAFLSRPGLFSWDEADRGSVILLEAVPRALEGRVADLGAGWGWLSRGLLERCPAITELHLIEAEARALTLAKQNAADPRVSAYWADATVDVPVTGLDHVVSNPPFHLGGLATPELGILFLKGASRLLKPGGTLWVVSNIHLPYEAALRETYASVLPVAERAGFKVLKATLAVPQDRPPRPPRPPKPPPKPRRSGGGWDY